MKLNGRYQVGAVLYFTDATLTEQVLRGKRRYMTVEQIAALTRVRVVAVETREYAADLVVDGLAPECAGTSTVEVLA